MVGDIKNRSLLRIAAATPEANGAFAAFTRLGVLYLNTQMPPWLRRLLGRLDWVQEPRQDLRRQLFALSFSSLSLSLSRTNLVAEGCNFGAFGGYEDRPPPPLHQRLRFGHKNAAVLHVLSEHVVGAPSACGPRSPPGS